MYLSYGHNNDEYNRTKSINGMVDEQLSNSRTEAQNNTVTHKRWKLKNIHILPADLFQKAINL